MNTNLLDAKKDILNVIGYYVKEDNKTNEEEEKSKSF